MGLKKPRQVARSARNAAWIEHHCRIPEGRFVGQQVQLTTEQRKWLVRIYDSPTRMFILSMGRKNAKTALAAFLLLLHLAGPEARPNSSLFSAAQSREQAGILFGLAAKVVRLSPALSQYIVVRETAKQLYCGELGTLYRALSAEVATSYGLSPVFVVHDELGQVRGPRSELFEALETACAAQEAPLSIVISTQATTDADLLSTLIDDGLTAADPRTKVALYTAPPDVDPFSDDAIRAANPHFDAFMNQDEVRRQAADAQRMPSREASFRNLVLNQRIEATNPFISRTVWQRNGAEPGPYQGGPVWAGLDLSAVADLTALVVIYRVGAQWQVVPYFWTPAEGLAERARRDRADYSTWHRRGFLRTTPGATVDYDSVAQEILEIASEFEMGAIAFDRWRMDVLRASLSRRGAPAKFMERLLAFGQGYASMSPAIEKLEIELLNGRVAHGNHPVLAMCASNAVVTRDPAGNRKLDKLKATGRIDGLVCLTMAMGCAAVDQPKRAPTMLFFGR